MKRFIKFFYNHQKTKYLFHRILFKLSILNKIGFLATGESDKNNINPLFITCDATASDINLVFDNNFTFPFDDNKLNLIYSSHNLEHLNEATSDRFFNEAHRILKKGGELSIEVPNAELIYNNYANYLKTGSKKDLQELTNFDFNMEVIKNVINNQNLTKEAAILGLGKMHNKVLSYLSCYCVPDFTGSHTPIVVEENLFNKKFAELPMNEFFEWSVNLMNQSQKDSGGHINPWFPDKLVQKLNKLQFDTQMRPYRSSRIFSKKVCNFLIPDREHRSFYSFRISALKN